MKASQFIINKKRQQNLSLNNSHSSRQIDSDNEDHFTKTLNNDLEERFIKISNLKNDNLNKHRKLLITN
jgi:hypothetical protein